MANKVMNVCEYNFRLSENTAATVGIVKLVMRKVHL